MLNHFVTLSYKSKLYILVLYKSLIINRKELDMTERLNWTKSNSNGLILQYYF